MKMTMCKERLCSHTSAAVCTAGAASACAETTAQARTLSVKNTMLRMVFFAFMLMSLIMMIIILICLFVRGAKNNGKRSNMVSAPHPIPAID